MSSERISLILNIVSLNGIVFATVFAILMARAQQRINRLLSERIDKTHRVIDEVLDVFRAMQQAGIIPSEPPIERIKPRKPDTVQ